MADNKNLKIPPHSLEAEASMLGSVLLDKNVLLKIVDRIAAEDFYKEAHKTIFETIVELYSKHQPIDLLTVGNRLEEKKKLEQIGGRSFLVQLSNSVATASHASTYAKIVHKKAMLRRLLEAASGIAELGYKEEDDVDKLLDEAQQKVFNVSTQFMKQEFTPIRSVLTDAFDRIDELHKEKGKMRGTPTGFPGLDNVLAGLQKADLIILAARPSVGKTSLALDMIRHIATKQKVPVGLFSLEMSKEQLVDRLLCSEANVDLWKMRTGRLSDRPEDDDFPRIGHAMGVLAEAPIYIDDQANANIIQIRTKARRLQAEHGLGLIVVDYLQLMSAASKTESRVQEVAEMSRGLKGIARELGVPVLALSQLSRAVEMTKPAIPKLSHLRESGCLAAETKIVRADTGERVAIKDIVDGKIKTPFPIFALDENWKIIKTNLTKAFSSGKKKLFELKLRSGRKIRASANHPFRTLNGWQALEELEVGEKLVIFSKNNEQMLWDEIISITPQGTEEVYDATVPGVHNFVAEDIVVHNSLEQDADVVMFIYRKAADRNYRAEDIPPDERRIAEIHVAKHRNGPTGLVKMLFDETKASFRSLDTRHSSEPGG